MDLLHIFTVLGMPNPDDHDDPKSWKAANTNVTETECQVKSCKRGPYQRLDPEMRAKIARYANDNGSSAASRYFSKVLDRHIAESTCRGLKQSYADILKEAKVDAVTELIPTKRGRPVALGELDKEVKSYVKSLRESGGIVSRAIVKAAAQGIVKTRNPKLLTENGGGLSLGRGWVQSITERMGMGKRKGTKAAKKIPANFEEIKKNFLDEFERVCKEHSIPDHLVINWDQTGLKYVPVGGLTLEKKGSKQVPLIGLEDKRQITVLLAATMAGELLHPQVIYEGKTEKCHPTVKFPKGWFIDHTSSHWSTENSTNRYIDSVFLPYLDKLQPNPNQKALLLMDVFAVHHCESIRRKLLANNILTMFVPANCTSLLQPIDLLGNDYLKREMEKQFATYYSNLIAKGLADGLTVDQIKVSYKSHQFIYKCKQFDLSIKLCKLIIFMQYSRLI